MFQENVLYTDYGSIDFHDYIRYLSFTRKQIWKLIPLREEGCDTIPSYINRINRTLCGLTYLLHKNTNDLLTVMCLMENIKNNLKDTKCEETYKADILRCCHILQKIIDKSGVYNV